MNKDEKRDFFVIRKNGESLPGNKKIFVYKKYTDRISIGILKNQKLHILLDNPEKTDIRYVYSYVRAEMKFFVSALICIIALISRMSIHPLGISCL